MTQRSRFIYSLLGLFVLAVGTPGVGQDAPSCEDEVRRALDFWIGDWDVIDGEGRPLGTNRVEATQNGCAIREHWKAADGETGQSMNYFDPADGVWRQHRVNSGGGIVEYRGGVEGGVLRYEGRHVRTDGTVLEARVVIEPVDGGRLHHLVELSGDQGATWTTYFDGTYVPRGGQIASSSAGVTGEATAPATDDSAAASEVAGTATSAAAAVAATTPMEEEEAVAPEPSAEAPEESRAVRIEAQPVTPAEQEPAQPQASRQAEKEGTSVQAMTRELQREEIPEEQAPELVMASPMVLEIVPGDIDEYPENAAWQTDETAGFICNEVKIKRVGVGRRVKRDAIHVTVTAKLFTKRRIRKAGLLIEVVHDGEVVASDELPKLRVGKNIPAHGHEGIDVTGELEVSRERFETMFAGDARPKLRLTLTCD